MQVQHLTIENSTIHIGQLNVEQAQQNEFVQVKTEESQPVSTGSRLPFNVLMLKSDKEKLLAKEIFQEQLRKKKPVQKVNDEPNAADESVATTETTSEIFIPFLQVEAERKDSSATISTQAEENIKNKHTVDVSEQKETETVLDEVCNEQHDVVNEQIEMLIEQSEAVPEQIEIPNEQNKFTFEQNEERPTSIEQPEQPAEQLQEIQSEPKNIENTIEPIDKAELTPKFNHHYEKPPLSFLLPPEEKTEEKSEEKGDLSQAAKNIKELLESPSFKTIIKQFQNSSKLLKCPRFDLQKGAFSPVTLQVAAKTYRPTCLWFCSLPLF